MRKRVLIPLPTYGVDPTEIAIPWKLMHKKNYDLVFSTPTGEKGTADQIMLTGKHLGIFKSLLWARKDAREAYTEMEKQNSFCHPLKYSELNAADFDAILLPGGHDKKVKEYLESKLLQQLIVDFFRAEKPVAGICHGVILIARSIDPATQKSVLFNYKTTALLKLQELLAFNLTRLWMGDYYLTYPETTTEDEVLRVLATKEHFLKGPRPIQRDTAQNLKCGFVVKDRNYLSARWPGDVYNFATQFITMIENSEAL
ncbi:type 1 glutamine amidotransferase domain-containing protein [Aureispira anguillae]|uniref:Type 1 glutamine amidotransferase domain-containing protein n=1 Tax=Aureispira anguillae TaxID=2864201 RepID=A0A915YER6_9BACT|nr:type 1 glutamine amidotransferase domain-containing protein [Aureispira anguillae]BDS11774.1 type 1 glutamine amidotransferase domain-containing protein [Aureispira anguillae]